MMFQEAAKQLLPEPIGEQPPLRQPDAPRASFSDADNLQQALVRDGEKHLSSAEAASSKARISRTLALLGINNMG